MFFLHPVAAVHFVNGNVATCSAVAAEEQCTGDGEVNGASPIGEEDEETDGENIVACDAVVGV
jgi:hypothetical protein